MGVFSSGVVGYVRDLYSGRIKRYHSDDIKLCYSRGSDSAQPRNSTVLFETACGRFTMNRAMMNVM